MMCVLEVYGCTMGHVGKHKGTQNPHNRRGGGGKGAPQDPRHLTGATASVLGQGPAAMEGKLFGNRNYSKGSLLIPHS